MVGGPLLRQIVSQAVEHWVGCSQAPMTLEELNRG